MKMWLLLLAASCLLSVTMEQAAENLPTAACVELAGDSCHSNQCPADRTAYPGENANTLCGAGNRKCCIQDMCYLCGDVHAKRKFDETTGAFVGTHMQVFLLPFGVIANITFFTDANKFLIKAEIRSPQGGLVVMNNNNAPHCWQRPPVETKPKGDLVVHPNGFMVTVKVSGEPAVIVTNQKGPGCCLYVMITDQVIRTIGIPCESRL